MAIIEFIKKVIDVVLNAVFHLLPLSPFSVYLAEIDEIPAISYINWFIPIGTFINIGLAWLGAITLWYIYSVALRWIKVAGS